MQETGLLFPLIISIDDQRPSKCQSNAFVNCHNVGEDNGWARVYLRHGKNNFLFKVQLRKFRHFKGMHECSKLWRGNKKSPRASPWFLHQGSQPAKFTNFRRISAKYFRGKIAMMTDLKWTWLITDIYRIKLNNKYLTNKTQLRRNLENWRDISTRRHTCMLCPKNGVLSRAKLMTA